MRVENFTQDVVCTLLKNKKIATLSDLKTGLGTNGTMTVFRKLKSLGYLTSYSHRGQYYTLIQIPKFDKTGLWFYESVCFSRFGSLIATIKHFIQTSEGGYTALELQKRLHAEVNGPLRKLTREHHLTREKVSGVYVYFSGKKSDSKRQYLMRKNYGDSIEIGSSPKIKIMPQELKAGIILFFSMLDEKQKRLYAGLEAQKLGHGGDNKIAEMLGLDVHTVSRGREELFGRTFDPTSTRVKGGGRKAIEKKLRR